MVSSYRILDGVEILDSYTLAVGQPDREAVAMRHDEHDPFLVLQGVQGERLRSRRRRYAFRHRLFELRMNSAPAIPLPAGNTQPLQLVETRRHGIDDRDVGCAKPDGCGPLPNVLRDL